MAVYGLDVNGFSIHDDADGWVCGECFEFTSFDEGDELVWATDSGEVWRSTCTTCGAPGPACIEHWSPELDDAVANFGNQDLIDQKLSEGSRQWLIARLFYFES